MTNISPSVTTALGRRLSLIQFLDTEPWRALTAFRRFRSWSISGFRLNCGSINRLRGTCRLVEVICDGILHDKRDKVCLLLEQNMMTSSDVVCCPAAICQMLATSPAGRSNARVVFEQRTWQYPQVIVSTISLATTAMVSSYLSSRKTHSCLVTHLSQRS